MQVMTNEEKQRLIFECGRVFSPSAPIDDRALFAGRIAQILQVSDTIHTRGQHAIIFGERGVGKSSLANTLRSLLKADEATVVKINCSAGEAFVDVWRKVFAEVTISQEGLGFKPRSTEQGLAELIPDPGDSGTVRRILQSISQERKSIVILDEFDRVKESATAFADTIKDLSDSSANTTLVLVGVAADVDELIKEHASIDRCLVQIKMPRMTQDELSEVLSKAYKALGLTIEAEAEKLIILLSNGLPHYTHLLGKEAAIGSIEAGRFDISVADVEKGILRALETKQQAIGGAYQQAISSQHKSTLFKEVLLACALAEVDEAGFFVSADLRGPLFQITGRNYDIPNFSQHLDKFSADPTRGPILEKSGSSRRFRFRFINPLMQPYVIMRGLADNQIDKQLLSTLLTRKTSNQSKSDLF